jgi:hypothetical protein
LIESAAPKVKAIRKLRELSGDSGLLNLLLGAPMEEIAGVKGDAQEIGGDEAELSGADTDEANDRAIYGGHDPALPQFSADENRTDDGQHAG